jgi:hypothetical protein
VNSRLPFLDFFLFFTLTITIKSFFTGFPRFYYSQEIFLPLETEFLQK